MELAAGMTDQPQQFAQLFADVFTASEGVDAGKTIGAFVQEMLADTPPEALYVFSARAGDTLLGGILFSRLDFVQDPRRVFILSPVAVRTDHQAQGVGRKLIGFGLDRLRADGVDVAMTYGDPAYYVKTGFQPVTEDEASPPLPLSHPHGWLGQALNGQPLAPLVGPSRCVSALNKPELW